MGRRRGPRLELGLCAVWIRDSGNARRDLRSSRCVREGRRLTQRACRGLSAEGCRQRWVLLFGQAQLWFYLQSDAREGKPRLLLDVEVGARSLNVCGPAWRKERVRAQRCIRLSLGDPWIFSRVLVGKAITVRTFHAGVRNADRLQKRSELHLSGRRRNDGGNFTSLRGDQQPSFDQVTWRAQEQRRIHAPCRRRWRGAWA